MLTLHNQLNYGDFLYTHDCKALNYTQTNTTNLINIYRNYDLETTEETSVKKINLYLKRLKNLGYSCELLEVYKVPLIDIQYV